MSAWTIRLTILSLLGFLAGTLGLTLSRAAEREGVPPARVPGKLGGIARISFSQLEEDGLTTPPSEVVFYLEPLDVPLCPPVKETVRVVQKRLRFDPELVAIRLGTKIEIWNEDRVTHRVFSQSPCCQLDSDMRAGDVLAYRFLVPGPATVVCRIHPEMRLAILVLETPHFVKSPFRRRNLGEQAGWEAPFLLEGIPPGSYRLRSWAKGLKPVMIPVTIEAGRELGVEFNFP